MLIDARWQRHLVGALHLEPLLKWGHKEGVAGNRRREMTAYPAMYRSRELDVGSSHRLSALGTRHSALGTLETPRHERRHGRGVH